MEEGRARCLVSSTAALWPILPSASLNLAAQHSLTQSLPLSTPEGQYPGGPRPDGVSPSLPAPTAFATTGASSANRFVSIGPRDGNFLNIPQQSQVGDHL